MRVTLGQSTLDVGISSFQAPWALLLGFKRPFGAPRAEFPQPRMVVERRRESVDTVENAGLVRVEAVDNSHGPVVAALARC